MASGGGDSRRQPYSEPRNRSSAFGRITNLDEGRLSSGAASAGAQEDRLNNWDFLNWKPSSAFDKTKRPKRGNEEKEEIRRSGKENIGASEESSPGGEPKKHRAPSTFPRTKVTSATSPLERRALENLRTQLTFSDVEEQISTDGMDREIERNNERYVPRRERPVQMSLERNDTFNRRTEPSRDNRNAPSNLLLAESDDNPDSTQIVGRLMQIRDYIKQASSMMEKLHSSSDSSDQHRATQLEQVISRLREQEQKYLELLLRLSTAQEEELMRRQTNAHVQNGGVNSQLESESEATELEVGATDESSDNEDEPMATDGSRPLIEEHLGRHSDTETEEPMPRRNPAELESTLVAEASPGVSEHVARRLVLESDLENKNAELQALKQQHDLLTKMLEQQEQLRTLQTRQSQLMVLQREAEQKLTEERDKSNEGVESSNSSVSNNMEVPGQEEGAQAAAAPLGSDVVPQELLELRQRLDFLKNIYDITDGQEKSADEQTSQRATSDVGSAAPSSLLSMDKSQLQLRLNELQSKKQEMDELLGELQTMRNGMLDAAETESNASSQARVAAGVAASARANRTEGEAQDLIDMLEARKKMKKLQEVRERLDQLKSLVQYYQSGAQFIHGENSDGEGDEVASTPAPPAPVPAQEPPGRPKPPGGVDATFLQSLRSNTQAGMRDILVTALGEESAAQVFQSAAAGEDNTTRSDTSEATSQLSSTLGAWGEDPQIQEKVRRLKEAKEKLHRLQDLVAMVQGSPEAAQHLPDDLDALAASFPPTAREQGDGLSLRDAVSSLADSEAAYEQAEAYYEQKMGQQRSEIERLMAEREKLLALQQELERLHDNMPSRNIGHREIAQQTSPHVRVPTVDIAVETLNNQESYRMEASPGNRELAGAAQLARMQQSPNNRELAGEQLPRRQAAAAQQAKGPEPFGVTFQEPLETVISNEELYGRMRQQRMLREELREKKKELEDMMRKDKPKKQNFSRHQDNQSDNVSFSNRSDPFTDRASQDQTAATWGGSTADNLESIEEDAGDSGDGQQADEQCDDGYPSDGIVQVEEEEEANGNDSDDRDTYTIEEDPYPSKMRTRGREVVPPVVSAGATRRRSRQPTSSRGAPFQGAAASGYNYWAPDNNQVLNNVRSNRTRERGRKKAEISALRQEVESLRETLNNIQETIQNSNPAPLPSQGDQGVLYNNLQYMASLQQQQMFLNMSQFQNQMSQQQELTERLARLERSMSDSCYGSTDVLDVRNRISGSQQAVQPPTPKVNNASQASGQAALPHYLDSYSSLYRSAEENATPFELRPNFPRGFAETIQPSNGAMDSPPFGYRQSRRNTNNQNSYARGELSDAMRIEALMQQGDAVSGNPYRVPEYLLQGSSSSYMAQDFSDPDQVPIETIQASDLSDNTASHIPRLRLNVASRTASKRSEERSQEYQGARPKQRPPNQAGDNRSRRSRHEADVIGRKFPTPSRAGAAAKLASQRVETRRADYRPGLSAGISGTAFADNASVSSVRSSVPGIEEPLVLEQQNATSKGTRDTGKTPKDAARDGEEVSEFSLFEALRETIYSEVATLISQNESRPHYLIEMFRELQMLNTDYLRQRFLYCVQDLVTKYLTEESLREGRAQQAPPSRRQDTSPRQNLQPGRVTSELTPSVSLSTLDEEEIKAKIFGARKSKQEAEADTSGIITHTTRYDFAEPVETMTSVSTPESNHQESPFAQDSLGDTVIHLDQLYDTTFEEYCSKLEALQRMKAYEERLTHSGTQTTPPSQQPQAAVAEPSPAHSRSTQTSVLAHHPRTSSRDTSQLAGGREEELSSSAMDNGSDGSMSDIGESTSSSSSDERTYPRIDTQQLDQQIKSIMTEIIPVLKEHMDDVCSQQLLLYIKRLVLSLTRQRDDEGQEFVRFFHKQLGSILNDSLGKFEGRKMRDCGEDLLVDLSEILFNELAFFRLMQDLDDPKARVKANLRNWHRGSQASSGGAGNEGAAGEDFGVDSSQSDEEETETTESESEGLTGDGSQAEKQDTERSKEAREDEEEEEAMEAMRNDEEEEQLGKERDDELAAQTNMTNDADDAKASMKITLAPSETKPMTRIGSDEDDEGDDAEYSNEDPADTAVAHDYYRYSDDMRDATQAANQEVSSVDDYALNSGDDDNAENGPVDSSDNINPKELEADESEKDADTKETPTKEDGQPEAVQVNGQVIENGLEEGGEASGEVTVDDLPEKLKVAEVASKAAGSGEALGSQDVLDYVNSTIQSELAGDPSAIKEPDSTVESSSSSRKV